MDCFNWVTIISDRYYRLEGGVRPNNKQGVTKEDKVPDQFRMENGKLYKLVFSRFITRNGKRIYHPKGKVYAYWVQVV